MLVVVGHARDAEWNESKHPRGQPENAGQFGSGGNNISSKADGDPPGQFAATNKEITPNGKIVKTDKSGRGIVENDVYGGVSDDEWADWGHSSSQINDAINDELTPSSHGSSQGGPLTDEHIKEFKNIGQKIQAAAASNSVKTPDKWGRLFRGETFENVADLKKRYPRGIVTLSRLTSTAVEEDLAKRFTEEGLPIRAIIEFQSKNRILPGIQTAPLGQTTSEVVIPRGARFSVSQVRQEAPDLYRVVLYDSKGGNVSSAINASPRPKGYTSDMLPAIATDPPVSEKQRRAMFAAAAGHSTLGIPKKVGKEFTAKDMAPSKWSSLKNLISQWLTEEAAEPEHAAEDAEPPKGRASSVVFVTPTGDCLFVKRSDKEENYPGHWAWPGGKADDGENAEDCAVRESREEIGDRAFDGMKQIEQKRTPFGWDHTTFAVPVKDRFEPTMNDEHSAHAWHPFDAPPEPLHPGVRKTLADIGARLGQDGFEEGKHPRGQPGNAGQFGSGGSSEEGNALSSADHKKFQEEARFDKETHLEDNPILPGVKGKPKQCTQEAMRRYHEGAELHLGQAINKKSYNESFDWWKKNGVVSPMYQFAHAWNVKDGKIIDGALGSKDAENYLYFGVKIPDKDLTNIKDGDDLARNHFKLLRAAEASVGAKDESASSGDPNDGGYIEPPPAASTSPSDTSDDDEIDTATVDVPLLIRLMEYAREDAPDDEALHSAAERLIALAQAENRPLTMEDYERIVADKAAQDMAPSKWERLKELVNQWLTEEAAEPEHQEEDIASGKLSETTREDVDSSKHREDMPADAFLGPHRTYPVKEPRDGEYKYTRNLLLAAARRARMQGRADIARRADAIRVREFGDKAEDADQPRDKKGQFAVVKEGGRAPSYHVIHKETKLLHHHGEPTFSGAQTHRKGIEENQPAFGPVEPKLRWDGVRAVPVDEKAKDAGLTPGANGHLTVGAQTDPNGGFGWAIGGKVGTGKGQMRMSRAVKSGRWLANAVGDMALDRTIAEDKRQFDHDGRMHVDSAPLTRSGVFPYLGSEINAVMAGEAGWVMLEPDRRYNLLRPADELQKAADTFRGLPVLWQHKPASAMDHPANITIGATGNDVIWDDPFLKTSLVIWPAYATEAIEDKSQHHLSAGYAYRAVMQPEIFEGQKVDGRMISIIGNHIALVNSGRSGPTVAIDSKINIQWAVLEQALSSFA